MPCRLFILIFIMLSIQLMARPEKFHPPVKGEMLLSGTFGELRYNHFHAGIDIKSSNGYPGDPIFSADSGYVSRIRVSASGYGNALYIDHPNGYTTVYAHLESFSSALDSFARVLQERHETFEIEIYPPKDLIKINRGEIIGRMGNTGSSGGVHLHFEVRNTRTECPINPLHWEFSYKDDGTPYASHLYVYEVNASQKVKMHKVYRLGGASHDRSPWPESLTLPEGTYAFGIKAYDPFNGWRNKNGLYKATMQVNEQPYFQFAMDSIPFHHTNHINAHIDHEYYCERYTRLHRLYQVDYNPLPIYQSDQQKGFLKVKEGDTLKLDILISDLSGKSSKIHFNIHGAPIISSTQKVDSLAVCVGPEIDTLIGHRAASVYIPCQSFYEEVAFYPVFGMREDSTPLIQIDDNCQAPLQGLEYQFVLPELDSQLKSKAFIGRIEGNVITDMGGIWSGDMIYQESKKLGKFSVFIDTLAPEIRYLYGRIRPGSTAVFRISDQFRSSFRHIDLTYGAFIGDSWCYASFDQRNNRLRVELPSDWKPEEAPFRIVVKDRLGNQAIHTFPS